MSQTRWEWTRQGMGPSAFKRRIHVLVVFGCFSIKGPYSVYSAACALNMVHHEFQFFACYQTRLLEEIKRVLDEKLLTKKHKTLIEKHETFIEKYNAQIKESM